ncbi:hypothetical protein L2734_14085, partial [Parashewanella spongiae]
IHRHRVLPQKEVYDHKVRSGSNFISQSVKKRSRSCPETYPQSSCLFIDENKVMIKAGKNYFSGTSGNNRGPALHRYYRSMTLWGEFPATASTDETYYAYPKGIDGETMKLNRWAIRLFSSREQNN